MNSSYKYLLSGQSSAGTGVWQVLNSDNFSIGIFGAATGALPIGGQVTVSCRLEGSSPYIPLQTVNFATASGNLIQLKTPIESLQAVVSAAALTGSFSVIVRQSSTKD